MNRRNLIGERVRQARKEAKPPITQLDLVARLQTAGIRIDQSGLSKIESGQRPVYDYEIGVLAKALKVPVEWLLEEDRWKETRCNFKNINDFIDSINFSEFKLLVEQRKKIAKKLRDLQASQRATAKMLGVGTMTLGVPLFNRAVRR